MPLMSQITPQCISKLLLLISRKYAFNLYKQLVLCMFATALEILILELHYVCQSPAICFQNPQSNMNFTVHTM